MSTILVMMVWTMQGFALDTAEFNSMDSCIIAGENIEQYYNEAKVKWTCQTK